MRVIARKERPHPGAQLRFTDVDGQRLTAFATNTTRGQLADLELRHRRRARCRGPHPRRERHRADATFRCTTSPRTRSGPPSSRSPRLTAWMQLLALTSHDARRWEPKQLRYRLFSIAARTPARTAHPPAPRHPFTRAWLVADGIHRLRPHRTRLSHSLIRIPNQHHPGQWNPAPSEATPAELSHPPSTIDPHTPATGRNQDQPTPP